MSQAPNDLVLTIKSRVDDASFQSSGDRIRQHAMRLEEESGLRSHIERLNETFGRSSTFSHALHAIGGGGALFAVGESGNLFAEMGKHAKEISEQIAEGKLHGAGLVDEIARGIPLFGKFYAGARDLSDALSGAAEVQKQLEESAKNAAEFRKQEFEFAQKRHEVEMQLVHSTREAKFAQSNTFLEGQSATIARLAQETAARHEDHDELLKKVTDAAGIPAMTKDLAERADKIAQLRKQVDEAEKARADIQRRIDNGEATFSDAYRRDRETKDLDERAGTLRQSLEKLNGEQVAQQKRHDDTLSKITTDFNNDQKAKDDRNDLETQKAREERNRKIETEYRTTWQRISDITAHAQAEVLRQQGKNYDAQMVELKNTLNKQIEDLAVSTRDKLQATFRDNTLSFFERGKEAFNQIGLALAEGRADVGSFKSAGEVAKKQDDDQNRVKGLEHEAELSKLILDIEHASADVGDRTAKLMVQKLETMQKFTDLARQAQAIAGNPLLPAEMRAEAARRLGSLPLLEMESLASIRDHRQLPSTLASEELVAPYASSVALAGRRGADLERRQLDRQHDPMEDVAKQTQNIAQAVTKFLNSNALTKALADGFSQALASRGTGGSDQGGQSGLWSPLGL